MSVVKEMSLGFWEGVFAVDLDMGCVFVGLECIFVGLGKEWISMVLGSRGLWGWEESGGMGFDS